MRWPVSVIVMFEDMTTTGILIGGGFLFTGMIGGGIRGQRRAHHIQKSIVLKHASEELAIDYRKESLFNENRRIEK